MDVSLEILNNPKKKEEQALKLFYEAKNDLWAYYRNFIIMYGLDTLLKIYDGKSLKLILNEKNMYIILGAMIEKDVNKILRYALTDNDFLDVLSEKGVYCSSLLFNIDYDLIKEYLFNHCSFAIKCFSLSNDEFKKLFNDSSISDEITCDLIKKCYDKDLLSDYFTNNKNSFKIFKMLNKSVICSLIRNNVSFSKEIILSNNMFEVCKTDSLINFRKRINNISLNSGNIDIEKKVYDYYVDLLKDYNPVTKVFHQYERLNENKSKYYSEEDYIVNGDILYNKVDKEYLEKITSKKISEIVVDFLFKDNIYNVFINIREILSYNDSLTIKLLDKEITKFYRLILNIDEIDNEEKINLFFKLKDKKIDMMFYDDLNRLKKDSYQKIISSLVKTKDEEKDKELSHQYQVPVFDYRDKDFFMLVRTMGKEVREYTTHRRDCYSLISNNHTLVFNPHDYIYGYGDVAIKDFLHVYEHDAYSSNLNNNDTTNFINRIYTPEELIMNSISINEVQILNKKDKKSFLTLTPTYIIAIDEINEKTRVESKRLGIPIILIKSSVTKKNQQVENDIRIKTGEFEGFESIDNYVDKEIDYNEELRRNHKRYG